jgi:hypothetical protein
MMVAPQHAVVTCGGWDQIDFGRQITTSLNRVNRFVQCIPLR